MWYQWFKCPSYYGVCCKMLWVYWWIAKKQWCSTMTTEHQSTEVQLDHYTSFCTLCTSTFTHWQLKNLKSIHFLFLQLWRLSIFSGMFTFRFRIKVKIRFKAWSRLGLGLDLIGICYLAMKSAKIQYIQDKPSVFILIRVHVSCCKRFEGCVVHSLWLISSEICFLRFVLGLQHLCMSEFT